MILKAGLIASLFFSMVEKANININFSEAAVARQEQMITNHLEELYEEIGLDTLNLNYEIFQQAMMGYYNLRSQDSLLNDKKVITIIDFTKSINEKRLYTVDLENKEVLFHTLAAHGIRSGVEYANTYSNILDSGMSSEGFMVTGETYFGIMGYSLRLHGQDEGINDQVFNRAVVIHQARATARKGKETKAIGRSLGCPSIDPVYSKDVIDTIKDGTMVFIYGKDTEFAQRTKNLDRFLAYRGLIKSAA